MCSSDLSGSAPWVIMPSFENLTKKDATNFLEPYGIKVQTTYVENKKITEGTVMDQKPGSGSIVDFDKLKSVNLYVVRNQSSA